VVLLAVVGIVIWQFAPIDETLDKFLPDFNKTSSPTTSPVQGTTAVPTAAPTAAIPFNRCASDAQCCINGLDNICDLGVDKVMYSMVHNAMSSVDDGFFLLPNHVKPLERALEAGYRGINVDLCNCGGKLELCHGRCDLGTKDVEETFRNINQFLDDNRNEVLMLTMEVNSDADGAVDLFAFRDMISNIDGLLSKFYVHPAIDVVWPSLRQVVASNKRILFFHFNGPNCRDTECPDGMHFWFEYAAETEFSFPNTAALEDSPNSCKVTRGGNLQREPASRTFFAVNDFVTPAKQSSAEVVNEYSFANKRIQECKAEYNDLDVNVISVDYWQRGDLVRLQQDVNQARGTQSQSRSRQLRTNTQTTANA